MPFVDGYPMIEVPKETSCEWRPPEPGPDLFSFTRECGADMAQHLRGTVFKDEAFEATSNGAENG